LNITRDGGNDWEFVRNIPVGQFYHINVDEQVPYNVYGGMQDNGSWKGPGFVWHVDGIRNEDWKEILFGDGFDVVPTRTGFLYAMYQGGSVRRINPKTGKTTNIQPVHPDGENLRFNWNGAIALGGTNPNEVYMGSQYLHYSQDMGNSWKIISPDLTTNDSLKQKQAESGGLTTDATQAENHTTITCISVSSINESEIWVGTDDGRIHYTKNRGETWNELTIKGMPKGSWVAQIELSSINDGEAFIAVNDYRRNNFKPYLFHSFQYGKKWTNLAAEKNIDGYSHCIVQDFIEPDLLFYGTEHGLFVSVNHGETWEKWTENFPQVATIDLKIQKRFSDLVIGTFGRAAFVLDDISPLRALANPEPLKLSSGIELFPAPDLYDVSYSRPNGERFRGDHFFSGDNKPRAPRIYYYCQKNDSLKGDDQKILVNVISRNKRDTIRTFRQDPADSLSFFTWYGDSEGVRFPSRNKPKNPEEQRGGGPLIPGNYFVRAEYDGVTSETLILVVTHPDRAHFYHEGIFSSRFDELRNLLTEATETFDELQDARRSILLSQKLLGLYKDDSIVVKLKDSSETIVKLIDSDLETLYMNHREQKGYENVTVRLNDLLYNTADLMTDEDLSFEPGSNSYLALQNARNAYEDAKIKIEKFLVEVYEPFKNEVEELRLSPFDNGER